MRSQLSLSLLLLQLLVTFCQYGCFLYFQILSEFVTKGKADNLGSFIAYLSKVDEVHAYVFAELWLDIGNIDTYYSTR